MKGRLSDPSEFENDVESNTSWFKEMCLVFLWVFLWSVICTSVWLWAQTWGQFVSTAKPPLATTDICACCESQASARWTELKQQSWALSLFSIIKSKHGLMLYTVQRRSDTNPVPVCTLLFFYTECDFEAARLIWLTANQPQRSL